MTTMVQNSTQSDDPYRDWCTEMERVVGWDGCPHCYGTGRLGLSKAGGGTTKLLLCRCARATQYPVAELVREELAPTKNAIIQQIHTVVGGMEKRTMDELDVVQKKLMLIAQVAMTPWWRRVFGVRLSSAPTPPWAEVE